MLFKYVREMVKYEDLSKVTTFISLVNVSLDITLGTRELLAHLMKLGKK